MRELLQSLTRHLHAFATEVGLTLPEWERAIGILTATGHITDERRQEFILWSDTLGLSMLVDALANPLPPAATESTVLGPFYVPGAPLREYGDNLAAKPAGEPAWVHGRILDTEGAPIAGAELDVWQNGDDRLYAVQNPEEPEDHLRGLFRAREDGSYAFLAVRPVPYTIPDDGPVGQMLNASGRHPVAARPHPPDRARAGLPDARHPHLRRGQRAPRLRRGLRRQAVAAARVRAARAGRSGHTGRRRDALVRGRERRRPRARRMSVVHETVARRIVFGAGAIDSLPEELARLELRRPLVITGRSQAEHAERLLAAVGAGGIDRRRARPRAGRAGRRCAGEGGRARGRLPRLDRRRLRGRAREGGRADRRPPDRGRSDDVRGLRADDGLGDHRGRPQDRPAGRRAWRRASSSTTPSSPTTSRLSVTAASGMNAVAHCVEALWAAGATPLTDIAAAEGLRLLAAGIRASLRSPRDPEARATALTGRLARGRGVRRGQRAAPQALPRDRRHARPAARRAARGAASRTRRPSCCRRRRARPSGSRTRWRRPTRPRRSSRSRATSARRRRSASSAWARTTWRAWPRRPSRSSPTSPAGRVSPSSRICSPAPCAGGPSARAARRPARRCRAPSASSSRSRGRCGAGRPRRA